MDEINKELDRRNISMGVIVIAVMIAAFLCIFGLVKGYEAGNDNFKFVYDKITNESDNLGLIYTPQCLTECYLPVSAYYTGNKAPNSITLNTNHFQRQILRQQNDSTFYFNGFLWYDGSKYINLPSQVTIYKNTPFSFALTGNRIGSTGLKGTDVMINLYGYDLPLSWFNASWLYKKTLQVNQTGTTTLTNIPILVNGTYGIDTKSLIAAGKMNSNCSDIRFLNSTETGQLNYDFDSYTDSVFGCNGTNTLIWVNIPSLTTSNTTVYMYYGNPAAPFYNNSANVYINAFAVFHMGDIADNITNSVNGKPCAKAGSGQTYGAAGVIGDAISSSGASGYLCPAGDIGNPNDDTITLEGYVKMSGCTGGTDWCDILRKDGASGGRGFWWIRRADTSDIRLSIHNGGERQSGGFAPATNVFYYYAPIYNTTTVYQFANGTKILGVSTTGAMTSSASDGLGIFERPDGAEYFIGALDEMRIWNDSKSDDWILRSSHQNLSWFTGTEEKAPMPLTVTLKAPANNSNVTDNLEVSHIFLPTSNVTFLNCSLWTNKTGTFAFTKANTSPITDSANNTIVFNYSAYGTYIWNVKCFDTEKSNFSAANWTFKLVESATTGLTHEQAQKLDLIYALVMGGTTYENTNTSCEGSNLRVDDHKYLCITDQDCIWINTSRLERCPYGCSDDSNALGGECKQPNYMLTIYVILGIVGLVIFLKILSGRR